jgi:hypothetical protein
MSTLWAAPYTLPYGTIVKAIVSAENAIGWNTPSMPNSLGATVQTVHIQMASPSRGSLTSTT